MSSSRFDRRRFLKSAGFMATLATSAAVLQACGATAAPTTTTAPKPAEPTKPAAGATPAGAATKPAEATKPAAGATKPAAGAATKPAAGATTAAGAATKPAEATKPTTNATVKPGAEAGGIVSPKAANGELAEQTIVVAISAGPEADAHKRLASQFTEYTKGKVQVRVEELPRGTPGTAKALATLQGKSDAWDVISVTSTNFAQWGQAGFMVPLKTFMNNAELFNAQAYNLDDFPKALQDIPTANGELVGFPQEASTLMFFYRDDLLKKYGIPAPGPQGYTWKELTDHALALKPKLAADGQTDVFPLLFGVKPTGHASINAWQPIWSYGQELFDEKWNPQMSSDKAVAALTMMTDFLFKHQVVSEGVVGYEYSEVLTAYQQGKAVMALQWNAAAPTILDESKSGEVARNTKFSVYPYEETAGPETKRVQANVWAVCVSAFSKKQEAAFAYATWFTSQPIARDYVINGGGSSGRASLLTDPAIMEKNPQYPAVLEGFKIYHRVPDIAEWPYINNSIANPEIGGVWTKQQSVVEGLKKVDQQTTEYLKDQGVL